MNLDRYKKKPFNLNDEDLLWVKETYNSLTLDEKIGQLLFMVVRGYDEDYISHITNDLHVGGIMSRPLESKEVVNITNFAQKNSKVPLLVAANLEAGGNGIVTDGTKVGSNMMIAGTNDPKNAYLQGLISCEEGKAVGANFAFAPVCDIDYNFRNPITNTRTYGSNPDMVLECSKQYLRGCQNDMAASIKHFPGDGVDERDQHLITSINSLSCDEWMASYGKIYKGLIEEGAKTVMVGHIMLPSFTKKYCPFLDESEYLPASMSHELLNKLLREELGFNGLIISDATTMAGFNIPMSRNLAVPMCIAAGCDIFLFTKNLEEDVEYLKAGFKNGIITEERLEEAVLNVLSLKASINLNKKNNHVNYEEAVKVLRKRESLEASRNIASKSITLVKEEKGVLPITPEKNKKILIHLLESGGNALGYVRNSIADDFVKKLNELGFEARLYKKSGVYEGLQKSFEEVKKDTDLIIYLCNLATKSNQTTVRIEWDNPMGVNVPIYTSCIPTIFISTENPYHLLDVPRVKTFINTYGINEYTLDSLINKLIGKESFEGVSPVDPFCGKWDTRLK